MSIQSQISLIDLSKQFPFDIDDDLKKQLCFAETLVISCGHYDGDIGEETESDSEWSCQETTPSEVSKDIKSDIQYEVKDRVEEEVHEEESDEEKDFHIFFFPDCTKSPQPQNSEASFVMVDGLPKVSEAAQGLLNCTCGKDKEGKCVCITKLPCKCGAKTVKECVCSTLDTVCLCRDDIGPQPVCTCKSSDVCVCHPDKKPRAVCSCDQVKKPCICHKDKFPFRECECKEKPKLPNSFKMEEITELEEVEEEDDSTNTSLNPEMEEEHIPCKCQEQTPEPKCRCLKNDECTCKQDRCICGIQKTCECEPTDSQDTVPCKDDDSKSICSCSVPAPVCTCVSKSTGSCKCYPVPQCTCGDPDNCKCKVTCDCAQPCICDTTQNKDECICLDRDKQLAKGLVCTCPCKPDEVRKLKKVRAGKQGYRWCHEVDPQHTYFDYAYGRHDKISYEEQLREKIKILGLHEDKTVQEDECPVHGIKAPTYKKQARKPSLDCCSAVGGISISVETLGEDKDKFLVQVVSHSSKEGAKTGSKLISIVDSNLHTMEENRTEHITGKDKIKERRSYMAICESGYYNKATCICGQQNVVKRFYHSFDDAKNFLLEGANVVLMRYFGLRRYRGTIKTDTVMMDGKICESIYVSQGVSQAVVNGRPLFVVKVERHIIEPNGIIHQTLTVLTLRGYMVSHEWANNNYILHLNPLLGVIPEKDIIEDHAPLREKWREDLQLFSDYLDYKSERTSEGGRYTIENGAMTETIREYLQALLLLKPADMMHFTSHYFGSILSAIDLPHNEYLDPCSKHVRYYFFED